MGASPGQIVKEKFGGKAKLVEQLAGLVDKQGGDTTADQVKSRLMGLSNSKLIRLYQVEQKVRERFGDRAKLVKHVLDARKQAGYTVDESYQQKLNGFSKARLLDLTKQNLPERQKKLTKDEKAARRRGRKAIARASAAGKKKS